MFFYYKRRLLQITAVKKSESDNYVKGILYNLQAARKIGEVINTSPINNIFTYSENAL